MIYIEFPDTRRRRLPFYLAAEEYLARSLAEQCSDDLFFMWQVDPSVIFGRNQIIDNEVNISYCRANGIGMFRRKSGGGCVYADPGNIMFSYITRSDTEVAVTFSHYTSMIAAMLRSLGLDASASSRNDILVGGRKVSGNAFYHIPGHSIVHGTMLFDTDPVNITESITPSAAKLQSKGVKSVRSRIITLSEHLDMDIEQFKSYVRSYLCDSSLTLSPADMERIAEIEAPYLTDEWIFRHSPHRSTPRTRRVDGAGEFRVSLDTDSSNRITRLDITGDFFLLADMDDLIINPLKGVPHNPEAVAEALRGVTASNVIHGLTTPQLIDLLF